MCVCGGGLRHIMMYYKVKPGIIVLRGGDRATSFFVLPQTHVIVMYGTHVLAYYLFNSYLVT